MHELPRDVLAAVSEGAMRGGAMLRHLARTAATLSALVVVLAAAPGLAAGAPGLSKAPKPPQPAPALQLPAPTGVEAVSGDKEDVIRWRVSVRASLPVYVFSAPSADGPWTLVTKKGVVRATSLRVAVSEPRRRWYVVARGVKDGKPVFPSAPAVNDRVAMSRPVGPAGATLVSSNGAVSLAIPAGALDATVVVSVQQQQVRTPEGAILLTPVYDIGPDGLVLARSARLALRYRVPVEHFQVAATLAAALELATVEGSSWQAVPSEVDTAAAVVAGEVPHFSYWSGAVIQPHGATPAKTTFCSGICHDLLVEPGSTIRMDAREKQVCYNCHGNSSAALPPAGATGPNVQASLFECPDQSLPASATRHRVRTTTSTVGLWCTSCHDPHKTPEGSPGLLRAYDAVTGKAVTSGNEFCWACHGAVRNRRTDALTPGYWTATGGDKKSGYATSAHASLQTSTGVTCNGCHGPHGGQQDSLMPDRQALACTGAGSGACHSNSANAAGGSNVYSQLTTGTSASTHHDVMPSAQASSGAKIECTSCHNPHKDSRTMPVVDPDDKSVSTATADASFFMSGDGSVWILAGAVHDGTPPVISGVGMDAAGSKYLSPVVSWSTNEPSTSWIDYGLTTSYELGNETSGAPFGNATLATSHSVTMSGLVEGVTYHYRIRTTDALGNTRLSGDYTYTPQPPPEAPQPLSPIETTVTAYYGWDPITFSCGSVTGQGGHAVQYEFEVYHPEWWSNPSPLWTSGWLSATSYQTYIAYEGFVYWRVRARDAVTGAVSEWSSQVRFYLVDTNPDPSCPTLYTWDGARYRFVTDVMGLGSIGVKKGPDTYLKPEPVEDSVIPQDALVSEGGRLRIRLTDEKEEIEFVDEVKLRAIDHPAGTRLLINDLHWGCFEGGREATRYFTIADPKPVKATYERLPVLSEESVPPTDVSGELAVEGDGKVAYGGLYDDNVWTFDLGRLEHPEKVKLVVSGWVDYANRAEKAAWLASGKHPPKSCIEVMDAQGKWVEVGRAPHPPGYPKTVVYDLTGLFPEGVTDYRVRFRIYMRMNLDYVAVDTTPDEPVFVTEVVPDAATLGFKGRSRYSETPYPTFEYDDVVSTGVGGQVGAFTRFGDVQPLLMAPDDKFVVMNTGDDLAVEFSEPAAPPAGYERTYVIHTDGFHQTISGAVDPMPFHAMSNYPYPPEEHYPDDQDHKAYLSEYNTRLCGVEPVWLARHDAQQATGSAAKAGEYSVDTDDVKVVVRLAGGAVATFTPAAAWESSSSTLTVRPTPASPGTPVALGRISAVVSRDGTYLRSDLATAEGSVNWQLFRFDVAVPASSIKQVWFLWYGHGEPTAGHPTVVSWWSPSGGSWVTVRNAMTANDAEASTSRLVGNSTFCLRCHDNITPAGVVMPSGIATIASGWGTANGDAHSSRAGSGSTFLKPGWSPGMDIPCQACHDTHGGKNLYHLTSFPGDTVGVSVTTPNGMQEVCAGCHAGTPEQWHGECIGCHAGGGHGGSFIDSPEVVGPAGYPNRFSNCLLCHNHGSRSNVHSDYGRGVDERAQVEWYRAHGDPECHPCHTWDTTF